MQYSKQHRLPLFTLFGFVAISLNIQIYVDLDLKITESYCDVINYDIVRSSFKYCVPIFTISCGSKTVYVIAIGELKIFLCSTILRHNHCAIGDQIF